MSLVKVVVVCGLMAALLSACGIQTKPLAGESASQLKKSHDYYGLVDHAYTKQVKCLRKLPRKDHIKFHRYLLGKQKLPVIQIDTLPKGPTIVFYPTPGIAQGLQIMGQEEGAEVIGNALLYPNRARGKLLHRVEQCTATDVPG
jgi:hypothetical protein